MAAPVTTYLPTPDSPRVAYTVNDTEGDASTKTVTLQVYPQGGGSYVAHTLVIPVGKLAAARTAGASFLDRCRTDVQGGMTPLDALVQERPQLVTDLAAVGVTI